MGINEICKCWRQLSVALSIAASLSPLPMGILLYRGFANNQKFGPFLVEQRPIVRFSKNYFCNRNNFTNLPAQIQVKLVFIFYFVLCKHLIYLKFCIYHILLVFFRATVAAGRLESGEDPRDLPGGVARVRGQPAATEAGYRLRQAAVRPDRATHARQPELGDVLLAQAKEQEAPAIPRRDLGRRHAHIVELARRACARLRPEHAGWA